MNHAVNSPDYTEFLTILQYSCAKTLARRKKISMAKIFKMYSKKLIIKIQGTKNENIRRNSVLRLIYSETKKYKQDFRTKRTKIRSEHLNIG